MVKRFAFRAQCKEEHKEDMQQYISSHEEVIQTLVNDEKLLTLSIFMWKDNLFLYYETIEREIMPEEMFGQAELYLKSWPGEEYPRYWIPMYDIFHYNRPLDLEHWRRKGKVEKSVARLARLKPETLNRYIYYHYQYQEEKPCDGNKTGIIHLHENLMFFYHEEPEIKELPLYEGALKTSNKPDNWAEVMEPHFIFWNNVPQEEKIWLNIDLLLQI